MDNYLQKVINFHQVFGHPIGSENLAIRKLRIRLLFEELAELARASDCEKTLYNLCNQHVEEGNFLTAQDGYNVNHVEELDALCDLQYVLSGKIITAGYHHIFDLAFAAVHANNMHKAHRSPAHALETVNHLVSKNKGSHDDYTVLTRESAAGNAYVLIDAHQKVIKPHDHVKVNLTPYVNSKNNAGAGAESSASPASPC